VVTVIIFIVDIMAGNGKRVSVKFSKPLRFEFAEEQNESRVWMNFVVEWDGEHFGGGCRVFCCSNEGRFEFGECGMLSEVWANASKSDNAIGFTNFGFMVNGHVWDLEGSLEMPQLDDRTLVCHESESDSDGSESEDDSGNFRRAPRHRSTPTASPVHQTDLNTEEVSPAADETSSSVACEPIKLTRVSVKERLGRRRRRRRRAGKATRTIPRLDQHLLAYLYLGAPLRKK